MTLDLFLLEHPSSTTCFNSHWLPQRTPQLPLFTFENLCQNCKHVVSQLVFKIDVPERLVSHLGVVTLMHVLPLWHSMLFFALFYFASPIFVMFKFLLFDLLHCAAFHFLTFYLGLFDTCHVYLLKLLCVFCKLSSPCHCSLCLCK
jgi:hypothetical protein